MREVYAVGVGITSFTRLEYPISEIAAYPAMMALKDAGLSKVDHVYVANMGSADVAVVDPADGRVERLIHAGKGAHQLFLSPDGKRVYVNNRLDNDSVIALDAATLAVLRRYKVPGGPDDTAFAPDGTLWLTLRLANKVAVLDPASGQAGLIDVGRSPHGIFLNPRAVLPVPGAVP